MKRFRSAVPVPKETRREVVELLNTVLASAVDLYTQAKHAHWNVRGRQFLNDHKLFDRIADHAREHGDLVAERIAALGGFARGTARMAVEASILTEFDLEAVAGEDCIRVLADRLGRYAALVRSAIKRCGDHEELVTQDLLLGLARETEADGWFLESHLEEPEEVLVQARPPAP